MARGSFTSSSGAPPKQKTGHVRPQMKDVRHGSAFDFEKKSDPLRHAAPRIPPFADRHRKTNAKFGFNTKPARPPAGRLAVKPGKVNRGSGREHRAQL